MGKRQSTKDKKVRGKEMEGEERGQRQDRERSEGEKKMKRMVLGRGGHGKEEVRDGGGKENKGNAVASNGMCVICKHKAETNNDV